uniref:Uncharacterized protein n=1 Tax=Tanacetum cinerariifolium TaxID=118510 RepID=A0A6L2LQV1_TANCI|nr:hypothetical protein [Tanacetum cinerariifolium]
MSVLRSHAGWKTKHFRGMTLEEIREKFIAVWKQIEDFVPMSSKEEAKRFKRKGLRLEQGRDKRMKTSKDVSEEDLKKMMQLVPVEEVYVEALQFDREDLNPLWTLVKETLSIRQALSDKMNSVKEFPVEYVLVRWKKYSDNVWANAYVVLCQSSSEAGIREIRRIVKDTVDRLVHFKDKLDFHRLELPDLLAKAKFDVLVLMRINKQDTFCLMLGSMEPERVVIKVPRHSNNKGTGSHSRWKNMDELVQNEAESSKKRRTCFSYGKAEGHNSRTCPYKDTINASNKRATSSTRSLIVDYKE